MSSAHARTDSTERASRGFLDEEWLTPIQIARKLGYATAKPVRKAILSGELKASRSPCRRKLIVAESEVLRWIRRDLVFEPVNADAGAPSSVPRSSARGRRRLAVPRLSYDLAKRPPG
jgi:hypothetical protein